MVDDGDKDHDKHLAEKDHVDSDDVGHEVEPEDDSQD